MRDVNQYFELIEKAIEYNSATEVELEILRFSATSGLIEGVLYFADDSRLEFTEQVVIVQRRPIKQEYRYHKPVGAKILPAIEPDFSRALNEAEALLRERTEVTVSKKRRQQKLGKPKRTYDE